MKMTILPGLLALALLSLSPASAQTVDYTNPDGAVDSYVIINNAPTPGSYGSYDNLGRVTAEGTQGGDGSTTALTVTHDFTNRAAGLITAAGDGRQTGPGFGMGIGISVGGGFVNSGFGTINAEGTGSSVGPADFSDNAVGVGHGLRIGGGFVNSGSGVINAKGSGIADEFDLNGFVLSAGTGISVTGDFVNSGSGTVNAGGYGTDGPDNNYGYVGGYGHGIEAQGRFVNSGSGALNAYGSGSGRGVGISARQGFVNSGSGLVTAFSLAEADAGEHPGFAFGLETYNGGFTHRGPGLVNLLAYDAGNGNAYGLYNASGGLTSSGRLTLAAVRTDRVAHSVFMDVFTDNNVTFKTGSALYLADAGADLAFRGTEDGLSFEESLTTEGERLVKLETYLGNASSQNVVIEPGARLVSLAATVNPQGTATHSDFIIRADTINGRFIIADNGVYRYSPGLTPGTGGNNDASYSVAVTRLNDASAVTGGEAGRMLADLESYWRGANLFTPTSSNITRLDDPDIVWLYLLADVENASNVQAAGREAFRQAMPQATAQSIPALSRNQQIVTDLFLTELLNSFPGPATSAQLDPEDPTAAGNGWGLSLWAAPLYHSGKQEGGDGFSALDQDFAGFNLGATWQGSQNGWGQAALGASFNYLHGNFAGDTYSAKTNGYGFSVGAALRFTSDGLWNPRLVAYGGWMTHDLEQNRTVGDLLLGKGVYASEPGSQVWNLGLSLDNDFALGSGFTLRPRLGLDYAAVRLDSYTESGPQDGLALAVRADRYTSLRSDLGLTLIWRPATSLALEARADWFHEFADTRAVLTATPVFAPDLIFRTEGLDPGRDSGALGLGLTWNATESIALKLDYACRFGAGYLGNEIAGYLKVSF